MNVCDYLVEYKLYGNGRLTYTFDLNDLRNILCSEYHTVDIYKQAAIYKSILIQHGRNNNEVDIILYNKYWQKHMYVKVKKHNSIYYLLVALSII